MSTDVVMNEIEKCIETKNVEQALELCSKEKQYYLGLFIGRLLQTTSSRYFELMAIMTSNTDVTKADVKLLKNQEPSVVQTDDPTKIRVQLLCNWCPSEELARMWNKMSKGNYIWNNIQIVWDGRIDYYVVINSSPSGIPIDKKKTILFRMEPNMAKNPEIWKEWANPNQEDFLKVFKHESGDYNNNEWHLSKTYTELLNTSVPKNPELTKVLSTVLSAQYNDIGHVKRVDFVKFLDKKGVTVHVFGDNKWQYKNYKGSLPTHCKDDGIFPYKYTFNAENNPISNYFTEKLIDGILGECLTFYWGCPNAKKYIDERAYVQLELSNFEQDYETIKRAIQEDWHSQRLPYIKEAKKKILTELQFFPRLEQILNVIQNQKKDEAKELGKKEVV